MKSLFLPAVLLIASPMLAQSSTIPSGYDTTPGNNSFFHFGSVAGRTMQVADRTNPRPRSIGEMSFRARPNSTSGTTGTIDAEVILAQTPWGILDTHFDSNQKINRKIVLKAKVNLPDWSMAQANPKFDLTFKFATRWVYTGVGALVWTIRYTNGPTSGRSIDRAFGAIQQRANGTSLGAGCNGIVDTLRLDNSGNYAPDTGMHLLVGATGAPANAPAWVLIDSKPANLTIPGLCTKLQCLPNILLPFGAADGSGTLTKKYLTIPYIASLGVLVTQVMFLDASQTGLPLSFGGGNTGTMPASSNTAGSASAYAWASGATATTGISDWFFFTGAPIVEAK